MNPTPPEDTQALLAQAEYYDEVAKQIGKHREANGKIDLVSAALVECQGKLKSATKDGSNPAFRGSKYATLGAVIESSREALYAAGLAIQQKTILKDGLVTVETFIRHKSGQWLDGGVMSLPIGESNVNSDAQIAGSICTYLKRYSWASNLGIYADEDDDGNSAPKGAVTQKQSAAKPTDEEKQKNLEGWNKHRIKVLNKLEAAAGQRNRILLSDFLTASKVITPQQLLEDWPIKSIPTTDKDIAHLKEEMELWHTQRDAQQDLREELI